MARKRTKVVTADGSDNYTAPCNCKNGGMVTISGTFSAHCCLEYQAPDGSWLCCPTDTYGARYITSFDIPGAFPIKAYNGNFRVNCPEGSFTSGSLTMTIESF